MGESQKDAELELSIIVPCRDEEDAILALADEVARAFAEFRSGFEVLFVDDGSRDATRERMREAARAHVWVRVLALDAARGKTAAWVAGIERARGSAIALLDGDLQYDPRDILRMLPHLETHALVNGRRRERRDGAVRLVSSRVGNALRKLAGAGGAIEDGASGLKVLRRDAALAIARFEGMHRFVGALVELAGATAIEIEIEHRPRPNGRSKYGIANRIAGPLADLLAVAWMKRRKLEYRVVEDEPEIGARK